MQTFKIHSQKLHSHIKLMPIKLSCVLKNKNYWLGLSFWIHLIVFTMALPGFANEGTLRSSGGPVDITDGESLDCLLNTFSNPEIDFNGQIWFGTPGGHLKAYNSIGQKIRDLPLNRGAIHAAPALIRSGALKESLVVVTKLGYVILVSPQNSQTIFRCTENTIRAVPEREPTNEQNEVVFLARPTVLEDGTVLVVTTYGAIFSIRNGLAAFRAQIQRSPTVQPGYHNLIIDKDFAISNGIVAIPVDEDVFSTIVLFNPKTNQITKYRSSLVSGAIASLPTSKEFPQGGFVFGDERGCLSEISSSGQPLGFGKVRLVSEKIRLLEVVKQEEQGKLVGAPLVLPTGYIVINGNDCVTYVVNAFDGTVHARIKNTGKSKKWQQNAGQDDCYLQLSPIAYAESYIIVGSDDGVEIIDQDANLVSYFAGDSFRQQPIVSDGKLLAESFDGNLYVFDLKRQLAPAQRSLDATRTSAIAGSSQRHPLGAQPFKEVANTWCTRFRTIHGNYENHKVDGKIGYFNNYGQVIATEQFDDAKTFSDGLAAVCKNEKWGFMNKLGQISIPMEYDGASSFSEHLAIVIQQGRMICIDRDGREIFELKNIIKTNYYWAGRCAVQSGNKWGFIDQKGNLVVPCIYDKVEDFEDPNLTRVTVNFKTGLMDRSGRLVVPPIYDHIDPFSEGLAAVVQGDQTKNQRHGYVNRQGDLVIPCVIRNYLWLSTLFSEGMAPYCESTADGEKVGFIDTTGKKVIPAAFSNVEPFHEGLATVCLDSNNGRKSVRSFSVVNKSGELKFPYQHWFPKGEWEGAGFGEWAAIDSFKNGRPFGLAMFHIKLAAGSTDKWGNKVLITGDVNIPHLDKFGLIDSNGKVVIEPQLETVPSGNDRLGENNTNLELVRFGVGRSDAYLGGKWGMLNIRTGKVVLRPVYDGLGDFDEQGFALVTQKVDGVESHGCIDKQGVLRFQCKYDYSLTSFESVGNAFIVTKGGSLYLIDRSGHETLLPAKIDEDLLDHQHERVWF